jgi:hypothetical protein
MWHDQNVTFGMTQYATRSATEEEVLERRAAPLAYHQQVGTDKLLAAYSLFGRVAAADGRQHSCVILADGLGERRHAHLGVLQATLTIGHDDIRVYVSLAQT